MTRHALRRACRGMSLIELMVGLAVGMVLVAGLALLFANTSQSSAELEKSLVQIENGRYATDLLAEDLSVAGYFGESVAAGSTVTAALDPCQPNASTAAALDTLRQGAGQLPVAVQGLTPAEAAALACLDNHKPDTPALVVRRLDTAAVPVADMQPGHVYVQSSHHPDDVNATYLASMNGADLVLRDMDGNVNRVRRYLSRIYYVAQCSECGRDTIPTLKRVEIRDTAPNGRVVASIAEGIEQLGVDYGFDTSGDGAPDVWLGLNKEPDQTDPASEATAAANLGWPNVVAARLHLVARSNEPSPGHADSRVYATGLRGTDTMVNLAPGGDAFKRRAYVTTVRLNSIAGARE